MRDGGGGMNTAEGRCREPSGTPITPADTQVVGVRLGSPDLPSAAPTQARGLRRWVYLSLGIGCLGMAVLGWILPVLPCTPWVLAASWFFDRSSVWFHRLLRRTPYFGHIIRDWEAHRGIRPWVKLTAVSCIAVFMTLMGIFLNVSWWAKGSAIGLGAVGVCVILFVIPTVRVKTTPTPPADPDLGKASGESAGV